MNVNFMHFYDISLSQDPLPNTQIEELTLIKDFRINS